MGRSGGVQTVPNLGPTGTLGETLPRGTVSVATLAVLATARLSCVGVYLRAGQLVSNISFLSGTTALDTGVNQWFALLSAARAKLAISADDTNVAWGASAVKTLAMTTPYRVTADGVFYLGIMVKGTTPPTLSGVTSTVAATTIPPILCGTSDTGLAAPATCPNPATALTPIASVPYAYVS